MARGLEKRGGERRRRGLPVRARDAHNDARQEARGKLDFRQHGERTRPRRVENGKRQRDSGRHDDEVDALEKRLGMPAQDIAHAGALHEALGIGLRVRARHFDTALREGRNGGAARAGEAEDRRGADLGQVGSERERHRSFNVESAKSAKRMATIQNRMMTFDSGHPPSSKWWWSGAMRKMRFPRSL